jgi:hypothetical protein
VLNPVTLQIRFGVSFQYIVISKYNHITQWPYPKELCVRDTESTKTLQSRTFLKYSRHVCLRPIPKYHLVL